MQSSGLQLEQINSGFEVKKFRVPQWAVGRLLGILRDGCEDAAVTEFSGPPAL